MTNALLRYSGLLAKTKAMEGKLLSAQWIEALSKAESVEAAVVMLKGSPGYGQVLSKTENVTQTVELQKRLEESLHNDYKYLIQFAGRKQREELKLFTFRGEARRTNELRRKRMLSDSRTKEIFTRLMKQEEERKNLLFLCRKERFEAQGVSGIPIEDIRREQTQWDKKMDRTYRKFCLKYPVSMAPVLYYLYRKQKEIEAVLTAVEGVRLWSKN